MIERQGTTGEDNWPSAGVAWYGVIVLMLAGVMSLVDRQVLNLLVDPIRSSLQLSDVQIGILQGPAFMVCYTLLGIPAGWWVDRGHRLRFVSAGIALWSVATIGCGLADSYETMLLARALVGVGEAVLAPAALSLIADYFSPLRRPVAMSVYGTAANAGVGLSLLAGGMVMAATRSMAPLEFGSLPPIEGWRLVFVICGLPGLLVAGLILAAREPARQSNRPANREGSGQAMGFAPFMRSASAWIIPHFIGISLIAVLTYGFMSWAPSYLIRKFGWHIADAGTTLGLLFVTLGPLGALAGGYLTRRYQAAGKIDSPLRVVRGFAVAFAIVVGSLALPWGAATVVAPLAAGVFLLSAMPIVSSVAVQQVTPGELRGRVAAIYFVVTNLLGASLGPVITALFTQKLFREAGQIGWSLATLAALTGPLIFVLISFALRPFRALAAGAKQEAA